MEALLPLIEALRLQPALVVLIMPAAVVCKYLLTWLRQHLLAHLDGNGVQAAAYILALVATLSLAYQAGTFADGTDVRELGGLMAVAIMVGASTIGWHETVTDRSTPREAPEGGEEANL
jgi:quinol-cytochrome oxidoreductase complex cytochrome b subunit